MTDARRPPHLSRRRALAYFAAASLYAAVDSSPLRRAFGQTPTAPTTSTAEPEHITAETRAAIDAALAWLAATQQSDGGFGAPGSYARNVGVCALAGLAFLSYGGARGRFADAVRGCTDYLLGRARPDGFIVEEVVKTHAPMYGHGYAVTYLGQVLGSDDRPQVGQALRRGVDLIVAAQSAEGSWRYTVDPDDGDVSVSACQLMALYSARQAGVSIPGDAIARGLNFLKLCQNPDGGYRYRRQDPPTSLFPRSAAAVAVLTAYGFENDSSVLDGRRYLAKPFTPPKPTGGEEYFYYGTFYAAQVAYQAGDEVWGAWYPPARDEFLKRRTTDGHWTDPNIGDEYATAMALIVLQFPYEALPLFAD